MYNLQIMLSGLNVWYYKVVLHIGDMIPAWCIAVVKNVINIVLKIRSSTNIMIVYESWDIAVKLGTVTMVYLFVLYNE